MLAKRRVRHAHLCALDYPADTAVYRNSEIGSVMLLIGT